MAYFPSLCHQLFTCLHIARVGSYLVYSLLVLIQAHDYRVQKIAQCATHHCTLSAKMVGNANRCFGAD